MTPKFIPPAQPLTHIGKSRFCSPNSLYPVFAISGKRIISYPAAQATNLLCPQLLPFLQLPLSIHQQILSALPPCPLSPALLLTSFLSCHNQLPQSASLKTEAAGLGVLEAGIPESVVGRARLPL